LEERIIPADFDFGSVFQLRKEALERWSAVRPYNIGQAARVSGIHPTDVAMLLVTLGPPWESVEKV
jgi:tRNA uridine 5-carboxymethylaminomethyl modification enzyme